MIIPHPRTFTPESGVVGVNWHVASRAHALCLNPIFCHCILYKSRPSLNNLRILVDQTWPGHQEFLVLVLVESEVRVEVEVQIEVAILKVIHTTIGRIVKFVRADSELNFTI